MSTHPRTRVLAVLLAAALSTAAASGVATASTTLPTAGTTMTSTAPGTTTINAKPSAFPATGKGHGSEQACDFYNTLLAGDQAVIDTATGFSAQLSADMEMAKDKNAATDAGCVVID
jgi:hypothetical protein